jgi:hypothetical protein
MAVALGAGASGTAAHLALVSPNSAYQIAEFVVAPQKPDPSVPYALP